MSRTTASARPFVAPSSPSLPLEWLALSIAAKRALSREFFNSIGQLQPLDIAAQIVKSGRREPRETSHHPPLGWIAQSASCHRKAPVTGCALDGSWKAK